MKDITKIKNRINKINLSSKEINLSADKKLESIGKYLIEDGQFLADQYSSNVFSIIDDLMKAIANNTDMEWNMSRGELTQNGTLQFKL